MPLSRNASKKRERDPKSEFWCSPTFRGLEEKDLAKDLRRINELEREKHKEVCGRNTK